jgi:ketosteroid isomerase-like protein
MRSRLSLILVLFSLVLAPALHAQAPDKPKDQLRTLSREELDMIKVLNSQERAWNRADIDAYLSGYKNGTDLLFVADGRVTRGFEQLISDYRHNYPTKDSMGVLTFSELEPHVLTDTFGVVLGKYHIDRTKKAGGPADGMFSLVFEKTADGWKIIVAHTT